MRKGPIIFSGFLVMVAASAIYLASEWPFKSALFPLSVSIPLLVLAVIQLIQLIRGKEELIEGAAVDLEFSSDVPAEVGRRRVITTFSWIIGFIFSVFLIGFPLTVPLFVFLYLKLESGLHPMYAIAVTAITWAIFYGLFQKLVHLQFEQGALQAWLGI